MMEVVQRKKSRDPGARHDTDMVRTLTPESVRSQVLKSFVAIGVGSLTSPQLHSSHEFDLPSGRYLASGSGAPGFESRLCRINVESLGKALNA